MDTPTIIRPKHFSAAMPLTPSVDNFKELLEQYVKLNEEYKDSCYIESFFGCFYPTEDYYTGYESLRRQPYIAQSYEDKDYLEKDMTDFFEKVDLLREAGFDFIYLLNSVLNVRLDLHPDVRIERLTKLFDMLLEHNITNIRIANVQIMHFLKERYSGKFNIYLSTNKEYLSIVQYSRLLDRFPDLKQICLSQGVQKDFTFIRNLKSKYPDVELEILANEGCLLSCPYRMEHNAFTGNGMTTMQGMNYELFRFNYDLCNYDWENRDEEYFMSRQVYPWDLDAYDGLIDTFKLAGRDNGEDMKLEMYRLYFDLYTNPENMHYTPFASIFLSRCSCNDKFGTLMISTIKPYLPKIEYFMNKKDSCNTSCGVTCNYCKECAEKAKQELLI